MLPSLGDRQSVFAEKFETKPHTVANEYLDYFGSRVAMFEILEPHQELTITSTFTVETASEPLIEPMSDWEQISAASVNSLELTDALATSKRTTVPKDVARIARQLAKGLSPHHAAMAICRYVHENLKYVPGITGVHSVAADAWEAKVGVCQDFSHIVIGALRELGIPARYVSGYLYPPKEPKFGIKVSGESHAWVEWWAGSWFSFDPTNDIEVGQRHIFVARGRDYDDVAPLRGVFAGSLESELFVKVDLTQIK